MLCLSGVKRGTKTKPRANLGHYILLAPFFLPQLGRLVLFENSLPPLKDKVSFIGFKEG